MDYSVILFESNNYAMWCRQELLQNGIEAKLVNVPRDLSSDCGYCIKILSSDAPVAEDIMKREEIEFQEIVRI